MKEATGELNMTVITVIAIAAVGAFLFAFLPGILQSIRDNWDKSNCTTNPNTGVITCP
ncbi:MAG TPA: hypothetical protein GXZ95_05200 [Mollicutes bacterium]|nr:hypothetical protein [Mollicutes bacterium]